MNDSRSETLVTCWTIWAVFSAGFFTIVAYSHAPLWVWLAGGLWMVLAMVAVLALSSASGRSYLVGTLRTHHYTQVYRYVARRLNNWVWLRVGVVRERGTGPDTPPPETTPIWPLFRAALTWRLVDRALLIAVAYPMVALILPWLLGGDAVLGAGVVVFPAVDFWPERAAAVGQFVILTAGFVGRYLASTSPRWFWRSVADWLPMFAFAVPISFVVAFAFSGPRIWVVALAAPIEVYGALPPYEVKGAFEYAFGGAFAFAVIAAGSLVFAVAAPVAVSFLVAFAGGGAVLFSVAVAFALASAFEFKGEVRFAVAVAVIAAGSVAVAFAVSFAVDLLWKKGRQGLALGVLALAWALAFLAVVMLLDIGPLPAQVKAILVFLALLPLINGLFDALSYAITLALSRKGLATRWALLWGLLDLSAGLVLFLVLGATMVSVIAALNAIGTAPLYDLAALFDGLRTSPGDYWWLYLILFSTLAPTALHLFVAALAVQGWVAFQNPRRSVARWIEAAPVSHPAAVGAFMAQAFIWWLPFIGLAGVGSLLWQEGGSALGAAGLIYLDQLEEIARRIGAI